MIELKSITYTYPGLSSSSLKELSLSVDRGEFVVIAGRSGSGKSTLARLLCGLIPHFHGGDVIGQARVAGLDLRSNGPADLAGSVGVLLQDPETQVVMGTVRSELAFPLENRGYSATEIARSVEEVALALGIDRLLDRAPSTLSGGELQRVALGAALATRPGLVVLDEPCSQLDPVAGDELISLLRRLNEEWGTTVVLCEHRLERCLSAATRVVALANGSCAYDGTPKEFLGWAGQEAFEFETPAAKLIRLLDLPTPPLTVAEARRTLKNAGLSLPQQIDGISTQSPRSLSRRSQKGGFRKTDVNTVSEKPPALTFHRVWHELKDGPVLLKDVNLTFKPSELVAVMGRNGAGKSTLLRHAAGLLKPTRGKVASTGRVALLMQHPGDYLAADTVGEEVDTAALEAVALTHLHNRDPKDLSGGERQRLALATVIGGDRLPAAVCLDEPTRGMDSAAKGRLVKLLREFASNGVAVVVVTHDPEFVADFAERVVLLAEGQPIVDGPVTEVLSGGWYFVTETARLLGFPGVLTPQQGVAALRRNGEDGVEVGPDRLVPAVSSGSRRKLGGESVRSVEARLGGIGA